MGLHLILPPNLYKLKRKRTRKEPLQNTYKHLFCFSPALSKPLHRWNYVSFSVILNYCTLSNEHCHWLFERLSMIGQFLFQLSSLLLLLPLSLSLSLSLSLPLPLPLLLFLLPLLLFLLPLLLLFLVLLLLNLMTWQTIPSYQQGILTTRRRATEGNKL